MKNSKGVTLASLVIIIASIILLATMAISFGYKYLTETQEADEKYFKEVLSNAVTKRENNHTVNSLEFPRAGYHVDELSSFQELLEKYVPEAKNNSEILFDRGLWYIVDNKAAENLGVKKSSDYIDVFDEDMTEDVKVALVDYYSGTVFIIEIDSVGDVSSIISGDSSGDTIIPVIPDESHVHNYNIAAPTCTEDQKCLICGYVKATALGHDYGGGTFTCEWIDEDFHYTKKCQRLGCGMIGGYERHTDIDKWTHITSGDGEWYHYTGCSKCGWPGATNLEYIKCDPTVVTVSFSDAEHAKKCNVCKYQELFPHEFYYKFVNENYHDVYCRMCNYKKRVPHTALPCPDCEYDPNYEGLILESVLLKNKEWPDSKFVTDGETIQLIITANERISDVDAQICGFVGDYLTKVYSNGNKTCTVELFVDNDVRLAQNSKVTFSVSCKSLETGLWMTSPVSVTTDHESYLTYDSVSPIVEYILKGAES